MILRDNISGSTCSGDVTVILVLRGCDYAS